jgi:hypothetical protein
MVTTRRDFLKQAGVASAALPPMARTQGQGSSVGQGAVNPQPVRIATAGRVSPRAS